MKRISLILASLVLVFGGTKATAGPGGPFDNGDYSSLLDNSGIYQLAMRFSNGSGFAQFGDNVDAALFIDITNTGGTGTRGSTFSVFNRSIIYYKGISYLGTCYGMVDHERKLVSGVTNGNSDVSTSASTAGTTNNSQAITAATTTLLNNGSLGFPCNTNFNCKITKTYPILQFKGEGELTIVNPTFGAVAYSALTAFITSQSTAQGNSAFFGTQLQALITALNTALPATAGLIPSAEQTKRSADTVPIIVFGSRKFFVSRR